MNLEDIAIRLAVLEKLEEEGIISLGEADETARENASMSTSSTLKTDKRCKVCTSPNRAKYEEYYLAVRQVSQVWALSQDMGEDISLSSFKRHFAHHFNPNRAVEEYSRQLFEKAVAEKIDYAKRLAQKFLLLDHLSGILLEKLGRVLEKGEEASSKDLFAIKTLLPELRQLVKEIRQLEGEDEG